MGVIIFVIVFVCVFNSYGMIFYMWFGFICLLFLFIFVNGSVKSFSNVLVMWFFVEWL